MGTSEGKVILLTLLLTTINFHPSIQGNLTLLPREKLTKYSKIPYAEKGNSSQDIHLRDNSLAFSWTIDSIPWTALPQKY